VSTHYITGQAFGPDGRLYATRSNQVVAYNAEGKLSVVVDEIQADGTLANK
jgi:hypothetical protein